MTMRFLVFTLSIACATASSTWVQAHLDQTVQAITATQHTLQTGTAAMHQIIAKISGQDSRRGKSNGCDSFNTMDAKSMAKAASQGKPKAIPASCMSSILVFMKTLCSPACATSPLTKDFNEMTSTRRTPTTGGRTLLGGNDGTAQDDDPDPSTMCGDPCLKPYMSSMVGVLKTIVDPACKDLISTESTSETTEQNNRRLLGGEGKEMTASDVTKIETSMGMLCSKNADGKYCMNLFTSEKDMTFSSSNENCPTAEKAQLNGLGCCWGNVLALLALTDTDKAKPAQMSTAAEACGVTLETTPCQCALNLASVKTTVDLMGVTVTQFNSIAQKAFVAGVAKTAGLDPSSVAITSIKEVTTRRASKLRVESVVTALGEKASDVGAMNTKLQDKSALQANIVSASASGSPLATATVSSSSGVASEEITGTTPTSGGSTSRAAIGAHAVMMVVVAYFGFA